MIFSMQFSLLHNNLSSLFIYICTITSHPFISFTSSQENPHYFSRHFKPTTTRTTKAQENQQKMVFMLQAQVCFWFVPIISDGSSFQKMSETLEIIICFAGG